MAPKYKITLTQEDYGQLEDLTSNGKTAVYKFIHARALPLPLCDAGERGGPWKVSELAEGLDITPHTIEHRKARFGKPL